MSLLVFAFTCLARVSFNFANPNPNSINSVLYSGDYDFIDLSYPFNDNTIYWPNTQKFVFTKKEENYRSDGTWYAAKEFAAGEHGGTHIDAPYHFSRQGAFVDGIPLEKLIVPLYILDVTRHCNGNPHFILFKQHLRNMLNFNMDKPSLVIFKFGWSVHYSNKRTYLGIDDTKNILNFPGLSLDVITWLLSKFPNIVGIGVDTASVDPGFSNDFPVHKFTSERGLYQIENVNLDTHVPTFGFINHRNHRLLERDQCSTPQHHCRTRPIDLLALTNDVSERQKEIALRKNAVLGIFLLNLSSKVKDNSSYTLRMNDVEQLLNSDMLLQLGSWPTLVVFDFGWSKFYTEFKTYNFSYPAISNDVTDWLTKNESTKNVVGVGIDLPSIDGADKTLARAEIYVIERLNLTMNLPGYECIAVVSPLKIEAASRVPTNIVAICPKDSVQENNANTEHGHSKDIKKHARSKRHTCGCHMQEDAHSKHGKEDKTDQTQPYTENGSNTKESNTSGNLSQKIFDSIKSFKNNVKIPGLNSQ